jgi:hypothetical protein
MPCLAGARFHAGNATGGPIDQADAEETAGLK